VRDKGREKERGRGRVRERVRFGARDKRNTERVGWMEGEREVCV